MVCKHDRRQFDSVLICGECDAMRDERESALEKIADRFAALLLAGCPAHESDEVQPAEYEWSLNSALALADFRKWKDGE